jgi:hypothetical protein
MRGNARAISRRLAIHLDGRTEEKPLMASAAKIFMHGGSQTVRLPKGFRLRARKCA